MAVTDLPQIIDRLRKETDLPPKILAEYHSWCAGEYAFIAAKLDEILTAKPTAWILLREDSKSAVEAEHKWSATPQGIEEGKLRRKLKVLEKLLSSLRLRLMVKEQEARQVF